MRKGGGHIHPHSLTHSPTPAGSSPMSFVSSRLEIRRGAEAAGRERGAEVCLMNVLMGVLAEASGLTAEVFVASSLFG